MDSSKFQVLEQKFEKPKAKIISDDTQPEEIVWRGSGNPATIRFSDGKEAKGSCIRCSSPPCIQFRKEEITIERFPDFPNDNNRKVCPTSAITWDVEASSPSIDPELCILCGLCISRCPARAIFVNTDEFTAVVNDVPNEKFVVGNKTTSEEISETTINQFHDVKEEGVYLLENDALIAKLFDKFSSIIEDQGIQFPNMVSRNLLIGVGVGSSMRRLGDTNIRMDLVLGPPGIQVGTGEVEFGSDVVGAIRKLLDNVAILASRYEFPKNELIPIILSFVLPNQRSEYWQVIKDNKKVLGIRIQSITIGALILLVWNRASVKIEDGDELYLDTDNTSLTKKIENILKRKVNLTPEGRQMILESKK